MALAYSSLIDEVQAICGSDTVNLTDARVGRWLNQSQGDIVRRWPGLRDVDRTDKTSLQCQTDVYEYDLAVINKTDYPVAHILGLRYIDTSDKTYYRIMPYVGGLEQWDADFVYIPDQDTGEPQWYVRRGDILELYPMPGSEENDDPLWLWYSYLPPDMSDDTDTPALTGFDEALIWWAVSYARSHLAQTNPTLVTVAQVNREYAIRLAQERISGERDVDVINSMADNGP